MTEKLTNLIHTLNEQDRPRSEQISELIDMFTPGNETASEALVKEATEVISCIFDLEAIQKMDGKFVNHIVAALLQFSKAVINYEVIGVYGITLDHSTLLIQVVEVTLTNGKAVHFINVMEERFSQSTSA